FNAIGSLEDFVSPPDAEECPEAYQNFVPNANAAAHYFLGMGLIYMDMAYSGIFDDSSRLSLAEHAVENFEAFVQSDIGDGTEIGYINLVNIYTDVLDNPRRALMFATRFATAEPMNGTAHFLRASALRALGRSGEACAALMRSIELSPEEMTEDNRNDIIDFFDC
ncbi:MAG: hypothetical protein FWC98_04065, partial [Bacteroidales bacterium]|nr:hypothetical protein [Bacteroidales bacterium]